MIRSLFHRSRDRALSLSLSPLAREILRRHLTTLSPQKLLDLEQTLKTLDREKIPGDVLEIGPDPGTVLLVSLAMPERRYLGLTQSGSVSLDSLSDTFHTFGLAIDNRRILIRALNAENDFDFEPDRAIAIAHIKSPWNSRTIRWLDTLAPHVSVGGILLLDDLNQPQARDRAIHSFLDAHRGFSPLGNKAHAVLHRDRR